MASFSLITLLVALRLFLTASGLPSPAPQATTGAAAGTYWLSSITRQGTVAYGASGYQVFRNVKDFGAKGDGKSAALITQPPKPQVSRRILTLVERYY